MIAAGRPLVVGFAGRVATVSEASEKSLTDIASIDFEKPVARVAVTPNGTHVEMAALICDKPHDPGDQDIHELCDGPSEIVHVQLDAASGREVEREAVTHDDELAAIGLAGETPVVFSSRSVYRLTSGTWARWDTADAEGRPGGSTTVCSTEAGIYSLNLPPASSTTIMGDEGQGPASSNLSFLSYADGSTWTDVGLPDGIQSPETLACAPNSVAIAASKGTGSSLLVASGGQDLKGPVTNFDGPIIGLDLSYGAGELIDLQVLTTPTKRTIVVDPTSGATVLAVDVVDSPASSEDTLGAFCGRLDDAVVRVFAKPDSSGRYIEEVKQ
jgi:hypothetical protein